MIGASGASQAVSYRDGGRQEGGRRASGGLRALKVSRAARLVCVCVYMVAAFALLLASPQAQAEPAEPTLVGTPQVPAALELDAAHSPGQANLQSATKAGPSAPFMNMDLTGGLGSIAGQGGMASVMKIILLLVAMTFIPALVLAMTSFTRIIIVLSLLRQAVGVVQLPPSRVLVGLALFLTVFTMAPVFRQIDEVALTPYNQGELTELEAADKALGPLREFMLRHTSEDALMTFIPMIQDEQPATVADTPTFALVPAFMLSELKKAFKMGALLFLPFLVIDIVVASILMSMGMMMLPPSTISLPLKIMVFVMIDGWGMVVTSLNNSFLGV